MSPTDSNILQKSFQSRKIFVAVLIGLVVVAFMLYRSLNEPYFIEDTLNGTHEWVDINETGVIDPTNPSEFRASETGTYKQQRLTDVLAEINWTTQSIWWILLSLFFMVGRDGAFMWRIRSLTKKELSWKQSFYVIMIWEFASAIAPGVAGGTAVAMFILNKEKIELGRSTALIITTAFLDNLFFVVMIPIAFLVMDSANFFVSNDVETSSLKLLFWIAYFFKLALDLTLAIALFIYPQFIQKILQFVFKIPFLSKWKASAHKTGENIVLTSQLLRKEGVKFWLNALASTWVSWISRYLVINCIIAAFISISFGQHLLIVGKQLMLWLLMMVSPTPGGSGVAEFAFSKLMMGLGASSLLLVGLALIWRLIAYFPYLFIGAILLPRWIRKVRD